MVFVPANSQQQQQQQPPSVSLPSLFRPTYEGSQLRPAKGVDHRCNVIVVNRIAFEAALTMKVDMCFFQKCGCNSSAGRLSKEKDATRSMKGTASAMASNPTRQHRVSSKIVR